MNSTWWTKPEELDDDQRSLVEVAIKESHLVLGPPGSGKTNLLLLRASYLSLANHKNILVIVFTKTLQEFISAGTGAYDFDPNKIVTCQKWEMDLLREYGVEFGQKANFEEQRAELIDAMRKLIKKRKDLYEAILLDEAHDYLPEEIEIFRTLGKTLFAVADSRQKIYTGADSIETLRGMVDREHQLRYHYRIGEKICMLADALGKDTGQYEPLLNTSNYKEKDNPSSVEHFKCADIDDAGKRILAKVENQLKAFPGEMIGILCPKNEDALRIWELVIASEFAQNAVLQVGSNHAPFTAETRICVANFHSAKGLEFRAVHLAGCEKLKKFFGRQRNMAFTAVTRAKTSLSIYYTDSLPGFFEQALCVLEPPPPLPKAADVFKKSRS